MTSAVRVDGGEFPPFVAALVNRWRGWRPISSFRLGEGHHVDLWLDIPSTMSRTRFAHRFRVTDAWRSCDGLWRHNDGTPLRADFITHWRRRPPAPADHRSPPTR